MNVVNLSAAGHAAVTAVSDRRDLVLYGGEAPRSARAPVV